MRKLLGIVGMATILAGCGGEKADRAMDKLFVIDKGPDAGNQTKHVTTLFDALEKMTLNERKSFFARWKQKYGAASLHFPYRDKWRHYAIANKLNEIPAEASPEVSDFLKWMGESEGLDHEKLTREGFASVRVLQVLNPKITDLSPLRKLTELTDLSMSCPVSDLSFFSDMKQLKRLSLIRSRIEDLAPLAQLTSLERLEIGTFGVCDLSPLAELTKLRDLTLHSVNLEDLGALANLPNLVGLTIRNSRGSNLSAIANLTNLQGLIIQGSQLNDLSTLANLRNLRFLTITTAPLSDISPLADLTNLEQVHIQFTQVDDVSPLIKLQKLKKAVLSDNEVLADDLRRLAKHTESNAAKKTSSSPD